MREIPVGVHDFIEIRESDMYYVDKTELIDVILSGFCKAILFARPRHFGKSVNLSMLDAYLNMEYAGNTWFDGLYISRKRPDDPLKNSFPVIRFDLRGLDVGNFEGFIVKLRRKISELYRHHGHLHDSDKVPSTYRDRFRRIIDGTSTDAELSFSIMHLSQMLLMYHGRKPVILIDDCDDPFKVVYDEEGLRRTMTFLNRMLSDALKGNDSMYFAIMTGVMRMPEPEYSAGLNNIFVNNIFSNESDEMFGFTSEEVRKLCSDYGHPEKYDEARQWYDGYVFGNTEIYNPWSVLNYVDAGFKPDGYWAGTSGNSIIKTLLNRADKAVLDDLKVLSEGGSITHRIDSRISYADMTDLDGIYSVMTLSGYLKAIPSGRQYHLSIPNMEMFDEFGKMVISGFDNPMIGELDNLCDSIIDDDVDGISSGLSSLLMEVLSSRVLDHEHSYQAFTAGMLLKLCGRYSMYADGERGKGNYDILLRSNLPCGRHIIM